MNDGNENAHDDHGDDQDGHDEGGWLHLWQERHRICSLTIHSTHFLKGKGSDVEDVDIELPHQER